ncbi:ricin-type beta-trefoil lectin domain protein [Streptomyces sp. NPDC057403]|uniref:ricin-type beta-trefoil lectin domain protein n=1 Tax=Streptomyces sp. NPDC057403 TaxID=3346119 RepID=UPI0036CD85A9
MERTTGRPQPPGEPAVWERPLPWLGETEAGTASAETEPDPAPEPAPTRGESEDTSTGGTPEAPALDAAHEAESAATRPNAEDASAQDGAQASVPTSGDAEQEAAPGGLFRPRPARPETAGARPAQGTGDDEPERGARVAGATVAVCAVLALGLGAVALTVLPGDDDSGPQAANVGSGSVRQLADGASVEPDTSASAPTSSRPPHGGKGTKTRPAKGAGTGVKGSEAPADDGPHTPAGHSATHDSGSATGSSGTTKSAAKPNTATAIVAGDKIVGYQSSKCIEVRAHAGVDGSPLQLGACGSQAWQKWVFKSDGSVRSMGLCLDIANASQADGAAIQLATCNGGWAQRFRLNDAHDLVNTKIGKCVDAKDSGTADGTRLQLWECAGTSNQKWHLG